jgi:hypothetical protein
MKALMAVNSDLARPTLGEFLQRIRKELVPLNHQFCYFLAGTQFTDEDVREYLSEPIAALPPGLAARLPKVCLLLVPFLDRTNGKNGSVDTGVVVRFDEPPRNRWSAAATFLTEGEFLVGLSVQNQEVADYHYHLYRALSYLAVTKLAPEELTRYGEVLREELDAHAHGEVDDTSWQLKQALLSKRSHAAKPSKAFEEYANASFVDTMTLYLHGICCDIDVEPGPRQIPSRHLRRRLKLIQSIFPAPSGYAVFPEELDTAVVFPRED